MTFSVVTQSQVRLLLFSFASAMCSLVFCFLLLFLYCSIKFYKILQNFTNNNTNKFLIMNSVELDSDDEFSSDEDDTAGKSEGNLQKLEKNYSKYFV